MLDPIVDADPGDETNEDLKQKIMRHIELAYKRGWADSILFSGGKRPFELSIGDETAIRNENAAIYASHYKDAL